MADKLLDSVDALLAQYGGSDEADDPVLNDVDALLAPYEVPSGERADTTKALEVGKWPGDEAVKKSFQEGSRKDFDEARDARLPQARQLKKAREQELVLQQEPGFLDRATDFAANLLRPAPAAAPPVVDDSPIVPVKLPVETQPSFLTPPQPVPPSSDVNLTPDVQSPSIAPTPQSDVQTSVSPFEPAPPLAGQWPKQYPTENYENLIQGSAERHGLNPNLLRALIRKESNFNPRAQSGAGAKGLTQMLDSTAADMGVGNVFDPAQSIEGGAKYMALLLKKYRGDEAQALAAYNFGMGNVDAGKAWPKETQDYVQKIRRWSAMGGESPIVQAKLKLHPFEQGAGNPPIADVRQRFLEQGRNRLKLPDFEKAGYDDDPAKMPLGELGTEQVGETDEGRALMKNPDGTVSSERTKTFQIGGQWMNIPTMYGGKEVSDEEAIKFIEDFGGVDLETGRQLLTFNTEAEALAAAQARSRDDLGKYGNGISKSSLAHQAGEPAVDYSLPADTPGEPAINEELPPDWLQPAQEKPAPSVGESIAQATMSFLQGAINIPAGALKEVAILSKDVDDYLAKNAPALKNDAAIQDRFTYRLGQKFEAFGKKAFPTDPALQEDFVRTVVPQALGSLTAFLAGGAVGMAAKAPGTMAAILGAGVQGAEQYEDALQHKATDETAREAARWALPVGATEAIPVERLLSRFNQATGGRLLTIAKEMGATAAQEFAQEFLQSVGGNAIAQQLYDENRSLFKDSVESGEAGGAAGAIMGLLTGILTKRGKGSTGAAARPEEMPGGPETQVQLDATARAQPPPPMPGVPAVQTISSIQQRPTPIKRKEPVEPPKPVERPAATVLPPEIEQLVDDYETEYEAPARVDTPTPVARPPVQETAPAETKGPIVEAKGPITETNPLITETKGPLTERTPPVEKPKAIEKPTPVEKPIPTPKPEAIDADMRETMAELGYTEPASQPEAKPEVPPKPATNIPVNIPEIYSDGEPIEKPLLVKKRTSKAAPKVAPTEDQAPLPVPAEVSNKPEPVNNPLAEPLQSAPVEQAPFPVEVGTTRDDPKTGEPQILQKMPLDDPRIEHGDYTGKHHDARTAAMAAQPAEALPPINLVPAKNGKLEIQDGNHRFDAAEQRGDETIKAWVPEDAAQGTEPALPVPATQNTPAPLPITKGNHFPLEVSSPTAGRAQETLRDLIQQEAQRGGSGWTYAWPKPTGDRVTIYRGRRGQAPKEIRDGDWVTLDYKTALRVAGGKKAHVTRKTGVGTDELGLKHPILNEFSYQPKSAAVRPANSTDDLVNNPRSELPVEQSMEMLLRAEKAQADLEIAGNERGGRFYREQQGQGGTPEIVGLKSATAPWYKELTNGPKPLKRQQIETAIQKIIQDQGVDTGKAVEQVKEALLRDREFDKTPWGEDAESIMRGEWPSWITKPGAEPIPGVPVAEPPATPSFLTSPEPPKPKKAKAKVPEQLGIAVPKPTVGEKPIIGREVTPETAETEAPLFSKAAQEPTLEQMDLTPEDRLFENRLSSYPIRETADEDQSRHLAREGIRALEQIDLSFDSGSLPGLSESSSGTPRVTGRAGAGIRRLGLGITPDLIQHGFVDLRGRTVRSMGELAQLAQIFRDPRFETYRIFYTKDNQIVAHEGISSRLPGVTTIKVDTAKQRATLTTLQGDKALAVSQKEHVYRTKKRMKRLGADGYYMLHNHPSGAPDPSIEDLTVTRFMRETVPGFKGHVVIDSGTYGTIDRSLRMSTHSFQNEDVDRLLTASEPHPIVNRRLRSAADLSQLGKELQRTTGYTTLVYLTSKFQVRAIEEIPQNLFLHAEQGRRYIEKRQAEYGAQLAVAAANGDEAAMRRRAHNLITDGVLVDYFDDEGSHSSPELVREGMKRLLDRKNQAPGHRLHEEPSDLPERRPSVLENERGSLPLSQLVPGRSRVNDEIQGATTPIAFQDQTIESRFQVAKHGVPDETVRSRLQNAIKQVMRLGREFGDLPDTAEYSPLRTSLLTLQKQKGVAADRVIRRLNRLTSQFGPQKMDLFTRKVLLDDLVREAELGRDIPFGFTPETVQAAHDAINDLVTQNPDVAESVRERAKAWEEVKGRYRKAMTAIGQERLADRLNKEHYFRHQVLEFAHEKNRAPQGTGKELRSPTGRGFTKQRHGSTKDINANYLQADFEVMAQMEYDIEVAKTIKLVEQKHDIRPQLEKQAKRANEQTLARIIAEERARLQTNVTDLSPIEAHLKEFSRQIGMGMSKVRSAMDIPKTGVISFTQLHAWADDPESPAHISALQAFKGISGRRKYVKELLGREFQTWEDVVPEGFQIWQPEQGNIFYMADSIPHQLARQLQEAMVDTLQISPEQLRKVLAQGGPKDQLVVDQNVYDTLRNMARPVPDVVKDTIRSAQGHMKQLFLLGPRRVIRYNLRNLTGDADAVFAGNPKAFRRVGHAITDLWPVFFGKTQELIGPVKEWFDRGGFQSTLQVSEMGDLNELRVFRSLLEKEARGGIGSLPIKLFNKYWQTARLSTDYREGILRYANYLEYLDQMRAHPTGKPDNWGASIPENVLALEDLHDRAYKLSNELLGAYDRVSLAGQNLRNYWYPFFSWVEVNFRRYKQLVKNAFKDIGSAKLSRLGFTGAGKALKWMIRFTALWAMLQAWNHLMFPDDEDELDEATKNKPHLLFGRDDKGNIRYLSQLGAMGDLLAWFGLDEAPALTGDVIHGRLTPGEAIQRVVKAPINKFVQGITPFVKLPGELLARESLYPDVFRPRPINDRAEYTAQQFTVGEEYRALTGKPGKKYLGTEAASGLVVQRQNPGSAAYGDWQKIEDKWLNRFGKTKGIYFKTEKGKALQNIAAAMKAEDPEAEATWRAKYAELGGTSKSMEQSVRAMAPLSGLTIAERDEVVKGIDRDERKILKRAQDYYKAHMMQVLPEQQKTKLQKKLYRKGWLAPDEDSNAAAEFPLF